MSSCGNLCTAAECAELRQLINELQFQINATHTLLQDHIFKPIPDAHQFDPDITVKTSLDGNQLNTEVGINGVSKSDSVELPDTIVPSVTCDIFDTPDGGHTIKVEVNGVSDEATLYIKEPELGFAITPLSPSEYNFQITLGEQVKTQPLRVTLLDDLQPTDLNLDFAVDVNYLSNLLKVGVVINGVTRSDTAYINANVTTNLGSVGGFNNNNNNEGDDVGCEGISEAMELNLAEILAAIAAVQSTVNQVKQVVTVEVEAEVLTDFDCPQTDPDSGEESESAKTEEIKLATLPAIHEMLRYLNENQVSMFKEICESGGALALPAFYQVRLGGNVPQLACVFRKGGSSTYHSISIPHPANTEKPSKPILPPYTKGSWQGMIVCKDNSKFIINCETKAEAERMCNIAVQHIDSNYLELPPRIYVGERKGQAVGVDPMMPTSIEYFESGQQNTIPNWRVRVTNINSI